MERPASDLALLIGRVALAALFLPAGLSKLTNVSGFADSLENRGLPFADMLAFAGAAIEFFGAIAVLIGFQTRVAAVLMVLFTVAATLIAHRFWEFDGAARGTQQSAFFKNLAIAGGYLVLMASGGGRYSIDRLWRRSRPRTERRVGERRESWSVPDLSRR
jgi:putative oxidoreductase